jgi:hypothetical protein
MSKKKTGFFTDSAAFYICGSLGRVGGFPRYYGRHALAFLLI